MATDRLKIYNGALLICGEGPLNSSTGLSENREARYLLDLIWNDGGVRFCLEQAQWHFAMRSARFDYDPAVVPDWGFSRAFPKPTDWVSTSGVFQDELTTTPLTLYADEVAYWFSDYDQIYVRYVSDHANFGMDFAKWPASFVEYVKTYFASKIIRKMPGGDAKVADLCDPRKGELVKALMVAKNKSAMAGPATFPTRGTWSAARQAGWRSNRDGGNPNSLIG